MLLKNLDLTPGSADRMLVNGSRGVVRPAVWFSLQGTRIERHFIF
jgi:hypothetical protein